MGKGICFSGVGGIGGYVDDAEVELGEGNPADEMGVQNSRRRDCSS